MWFALDLDQTLIDAALVPLPDAVEVLNLLYDKGYTLTVVSYNLDVESIVKDLGWQQYFRKVICDRTRTKAQIIKDISPELGLKPGDAVLIDDLDDNVHTCLAAGIHALQVNPHVGFQMSEAHTLLHYFQLPVMWVAPVLPEHRMAVQAACPNYFLRFYPVETGMDELEIYARDNTNPASVVGCLQLQQDIYGKHYLLSLRDVNSVLLTCGRSLSIPHGRAVKAYISRVTISDILYQLFTIAMEELEHQVREHYYQQYIWTFKESLPQGQSDVENMWEAQPSTPIPDILIEKNLAPITPPLLEH